MQKCLNTYTSRLWIVSWCSTVPVGLLPTDTHCIPQTGKMSKRRVAFALRLFPGALVRAEPWLASRATQMQTPPSDSGPAPDPHNHSFPFKWTPEMSLLPLNTPVLMCPLKNSAWPNVKYLSTVWHPKGEDRMPRAAPRSRENTTASQNSAFTDSTVLPFCNSGISSYWKSFTAPGAKVFYSSKALPLTNSTDQTFAILVYIRW